MGQRGPVFWTKEGEEEGEVVGEGQLVPVSWRVEVGLGFWTKEGVVVVWQRIMGGWRDLLWRGRERIVGNESI